MRWTVLSEIPDCSASSCCERCRSSRYVFKVFFNAYQVAKTKAQPKVAIFEHAPKHFPLRFVVVLCTKKIVDHLTFVCMPEGPSIVILRETVERLQLAGQKIQSVEGNSKIDQDRLPGQTVLSFRSWGKHFLICFQDFTVRIHFLMFGSYRINERKETPVRLRIQFANDELNFYTCSVKLIDKPVDQIYEWSGDIMAANWSAANALKKLKTIPQGLCCDALLDQDIFAGSGNIIKNEVLFRIKVHPLSALGALPESKLKEMVREVRQYAFDFLHWKKEFTLRKHWLAHTKKICPRCDIPFTKAHTGKTNRRSFFCSNCQVLYALNNS